ncbi:MAG: hypothetical protein ABIL20_03275 [candidate division WOR-3 bacterium]
MNKIKLNKKFLQLMIVLLVPLFLTAADDYPKLLGKWKYESGQETINLEFKTENLLIYNGEDIGYMLGDGVIRVEDEFLGYVDYPYSLEKDLLKITYPNGYTLEFKRLKSQTKDKVTTETKTGGASDLIQHFAGTWKNYTKYTETMVVLFPDGTYGSRYSSSYSSAEPGEEWGVAADVHRQGRWTVRGTREQGVITCITEDGSEVEYQYQVHVEGGEVYWSEYYFNGDLYGKVNE